MRLIQSSDRRRVLAGLGLASLGLAGRAISAGAVSAEPAPCMMIAGPPAGRLDRWADLLVGSIGRTLVSRTPLIRQNVGGLDGVTGANQFEARSEADGNTVLLVPGSAALSWLVGETRARFDPGRWVPLWAGAGSGVLVSRSGLQAGRTLRVAASGPAGPEMAALMTLDLLGINGLVGPAQGAEALFLQGANLPEALQAAAMQGFQPVLTLGILGSAGEILRDPLLDGIPTAVELVQGRASLEMIGAVRAASLAALLEAGLVLPQMTPAASVALWRRACLPLLSDPEVIGEAGRLGGRLVSATAASSCTSRLAADPAVLLALRRWLATRYDWRPA